MITVKYYNDSNKYVGWEKFNKDNSLSYRSWINSGNSIRIGNMIFDKDNIDTLLKTPLYRIVRTVEDRVLDIYGRVWDLTDREVCPDCGQPDSCGDCTHGRLTNADVDYLQNG